MLNSLLTAHLSLVFYIVTCRDHLITNDPFIRIHCFHVSFLQTNNSKVKGGGGGGGGERQRETETERQRQRERKNGPLLWSWLCQTYVRPSCMEGCLSSCICCSVVRFPVSFCLLLQSWQQCCTCVGPSCVEFCPLCHVVTRFSSFCLLLSQCSSIGHTSARPSCVEFCPLCYVVIRFSILCPLLQSWLCHTCRNYVHRRLIQLCSTYQHQHF